MKAPFILFLIALTIRLIVIIYWRFDGLYGQDAFAYFDQAAAITQNLPHGLPPPSDFFWPNGYPLLMAGFMLVLGRHALAGQIPALLCGTLLAPLVYLLSQSLFGVNGDVNESPAIRSQRGVLSGFIIASAGQPILSSVVVMADVPALFWATLGVWVSVHTIKYKQEGKRAGEQGRIFSPAPLLPCSPAFYWFAVGMALGMAIISRWLYLLVIPAMGVYLIFTLYQQRQPKHHRVFLGVFWAILGGILIVAPQLWLSLPKPEGLAHSWLLGWSPANFWRREFENIDGHFVYAWPNAIFYAQPALHPAYIFPLLGLAGLWGVRRLWQTKQWGPLILLLGWVAPVYLFLAGIPYQNFRFGLTHYLPFVLLAGFGLSDLLSAAIKVQGSGGAEEQRRIFPPAPLLLRSPVVLNVAITLSVVAMLAWAYPMLNSFLTTQNQSKMIAQQVEQVLPGEATLLTFGLTLTIKHYTRLNTLEFFYQDVTSLDTLIESHQPLYLLLDVTSITTQWRGKIPQANYEWLKEHTDLAQTNTFPPYTLFKVTKIK
jgi:4-amino-4-deoxy-L-arabinose transferase-like glycosyltransferase